MLKPLFGGRREYADFRPRITRYLAGLVGEFEAEDLSQDVFIRISRALHTFRGESSLSTWIYRIATNAAFDRLRQSSYKFETSRTFLETQGLSEEAPNPQTWTGESAPAIEQHLHHKERYECFCRFIEKLPENYRLIVILNRLEDFTAQEIADILGLSVSVVKVRLHRGRARLLEELKAHCKPEDWL